MTAQSGTRAGLGLAVNGGAIIALATAAALLVAGAGNQRRHHRPTPAHDREPAAPSACPR